uniref:Cytochrome P450 9e2 n=1 Tax=Locusta migratoria migratoria TaxID=238695 RepID=A0A6G5XGD7_LOCMI|nr:Cytochrome P450 9e2 [Locusta migratoria migratoria]
MRNVLFQRYDPFAIGRGFIRTGKGPLTNAAVARMVSKFEATGGLDGRPRSGRPSTKCNAAETVQKEMETVAGLSMHVEVSARAVSRRTGIPYAPAAVAEVTEALQSRIPLMMIRDPDLIRAVTVKDFDHFTDHMDFINADKNNPLSQRMLVALKGKEWHDMRTTLSPAFTTMKMKNMFTLIREIGQQIVTYLDSQTAEYKAILQKLTDKRSVCRLFSSSVTSFKGSANKTQSLVRLSHDIIYVIFTTHYFTIGGRGCIKTHVLPLSQTIPRKLIGRKIKFFRYLNLYVSALRRNWHNFVNSHRDRLHTCAREQHLKKTTCHKVLKKRLTNDDMAAQAILFFFGGFDTVSTLMTFCSYLLATHQEIQARLQREVDEVMKKSGGQPDYEQVIGCQYLDMVISETLRMYTPGTAMDRVCVRPYQLPDTETCRGVKLRPGEIIWIPVHGIHHDAKYYPDPETFDPERFSPENKHNIKPFTYFPFGSGPRVCIAQRFALMEVKLVFLYLMSKFSFQVVPKTPVPLQIQPDKLALSIKGGAWIGIRRRS